MALARLGAFRGRMLLAGMTAAPIVMPEVITGLSLLLLFVALQQLIGWPKGVGAVTITLAHITFCMAYVTVVVQSRLAGFDEALEEAAMDLRRAAGRGILPHHAAAHPAGNCLRVAAGLYTVLGRSGHPRSSSRDRVPAHCRWFIFSKVRFGVTPDVNALARSWCCLVATGIAISTVWMRARQQRRARDLQLAAAANL